MNLWKPLALVSLSACVFSVGMQVASASKPTKVEGAQPHMEAALAALNTAKGELQKAEHDKGGWRAAALKATETAITETNRGINFADKH
jgi:hypothetical protein